jgi:hypothetical protein
MINNGGIAQRAPGDRERDISDPIVDNFMQAQKADWVSTGFSTNQYTYNQISILQVRLLSGHEIALVSLDGRDIFLGSGQDQLAWLEPIGNSFIPWNNGV